MMRIGARTAHGLCCTLLGLTGLVSAYIPAQATNDSSLVSVTNSSISLSWDEGSYSVPISFQLTGSGSLGYSQGAIVHYSEYNASDPPTLSPFIALISCDRNITNTTLENDIFTMANSSGAIAALLYTTTAQACLINPDYANPDNFDRVLDIYTTVRMSSAKLIESQWNEVNSSYYWYDSGMLNASGEAINQYIGGRQRVAPGFLMASLTANTSNPLNATHRGGDDGGDGGGGGGGGGPNTSTAMIVLYSITGCVCALFCIVIGSGAIRAFRHPERYSANPARFLLGGGRAANDPSNRPGAAPPSRAGLGRAMLDSFPLIKFGASTPPAAVVVPPGQAQGKDVDIERDAEDWKQREGEADAVEMGKLSLTPESGAPGGVHTLPVWAAQFPRDGKHAEAEAERASTHGDSSNSSYSHQTPHAADHTHETEAVPEGDADVAAPIDPSALGHETCPICIFDFENGDDLRVLPCEGRHRFHQACVDPWLLELSSSCPICRADFGQLEHMAAAGNAQSQSPPQSQSHAVPLSLAMNPYLNHPIDPSVNPSSPRILQHGSPAALFSRYLRSAQHRRDSRRRTRDNRSRSQAGAGAGGVPGGDTSLAPELAGSPGAGVSSSGGMRPGSTASLPGYTAPNTPPETGSGAPQLPALPRSGSTTLM